MNDRDIGWVAGLIEGEGNIGVYRNGGSGLYRVAQVKVNMTDFDVVRRLASVTGLGRLQDRKTQHKPQLQWVVTRQAELLQLLPTIWPVLGERKQAAATEAIVHVLASPGRGWRRNQRSAA